MAHHVHKGYDASNFRTVPPYIGQGAYKWSGEAEDCPWCSPQANRRQALIDQAVRAIVGAIVYRHLSRLNGPRGWRLIEELGKDFQHAIRTEFRRLEAENGN